METVDIYELHKEIGYVYDSSRPAAAKSSAADIGSMGGSPNDEMLRYVTSKDPVRIGSVPVTARTLALAPVLRVEHASAHMP